MLNPLEIMEERHLLNTRQADPVCDRKGKLTEPLGVLGPQASLTLWEKKSKQPLPFTKEGDARGAFANSLSFTSLVAEFLQ